MSTLYARLRQLAATLSAGPRCSSCGSPDLHIGHGDGDLLCYACEEMREEARQIDLARIAAYWTPERNRQMGAAMGGYGVAPRQPRRVF